jgi:hypothetical protein
MTARFARMEMPERPSTKLLIQSDEQLCEPIVGSVSMSVSFAAGGNPLD